jgi:hypothetical protein
MHVHVFYKFVDFIKLFSKYTLQMCKSQNVHVCTYMEMSLQIKLAVHAIVSYSISEQNKHIKHVKIR